MAHLRYVEVTDLTYHTTEYPLNLHMVSGTNAANPPEVPTSVCIRLSAKHRVLASASASIHAEPEPILHLEVTSDDPRLLGALDAGRRRFAIAHAWHPGAVRAHVWRTNLRASIRGGVGDCEVRATFIPDYSQAIQPLVDAHAIEFLVANLPDFRRSMAARTHPELGRTGLFLTTPDYEVLINPVNYPADVASQIPGTTYRHIARVQHAGQCLIAAHDTARLLKLTCLFLHFLSGRGAYPAQIRKLRQGVVVGATTGPVPTSRGVGSISNQLTRVGEWCEYLEPTFGAFAALFTAEAAQTRFAEILRWRDAAATNGPASLRIAAAYTALEELGLMTYTRLITCASNNDHPAGTNKKYGKLAARDKIKIALYRLKCTPNPWLSPAYTPLSELARRKGWAPWDLITELRHLALHSENHAQFAGYSHRLAELASDYAVDAFNAVILMDIGFHGTLPPRATPFNHEAFIWFPLPTT